MLIASAQFSVRLVGLKGFIASIDYDTSSGWTGHTWGFYTEINTTRNKFGIEILCILQFKMVCEITLCSLSSKGYK